MKNWLHSRTTQKYQQKIGERKDITRKSAGVRETLREKRGENKGEKTETETDTKSVCVRVRERDR